MIFIKLYQLLYYICTYLHYNFSELTKYLCMRNYLQIVFGQNILYNLNSKTNKKQCWVNTTFSDIYCRYKTDNRYIDSKSDIRYINRYKYWFDKKPTPNLPIVPILTDINISYRYKLSRRRKVKRMRFSVFEHSTT